MLRMLLLALVTCCASLSSHTTLAKPEARAAGNSKAPSTPTRNQDFGRALAAAARAQTWIPVLYDPSYRKIDYPMGDVPWYRGVCTDVVVRAYRRLGIDLQELVHRSKLGSDDPNIDHRRVDVLRRFFAGRGQSLSVTKNPADYAPGDLVTYHLPNGTFSKTHIAIVSDRKSSRGVPLVIHNRGLGVWEEDWLYSEPITGHYRYAPGGASGRTAASAR